MEAKSIESLAEELGRAAREHGARIATAESCTAGGISYAITSVPGSSGWVVTGIAGPDGAEPDKPVGTVCFGFAERTASGIVIESETCHFTGDRAAVRESTVRQALAGLLKRINETSL